MRVIRECWRGSTASIRATRVRELRTRHGETVLRQPVICANGMWRDIKTAQMSTVRVARYSAAAKAPALSYAAMGFIGARALDR